MYKGMGSGRFADYISFFLNILISHENENHGDQIILFS